MKLLRILVVILLLNIPAWCAVAKDVSMTTGNSADGLNQEVSAAASISSTGINVGGSATLLVCVFSYQMSSIGSDMASLAITWNSTPMTRGPHLSRIIGGGGNPYIGVEIWTLPNPASGAKTLAATWTGNADVYMSAISFTGTDTSTGINAANSVTQLRAADPATITVTSTTDGATVACMTVNGSTPTVTFTKIYAEAPFAPGGGADFSLGGTSHVHSFSGGGGTDQVLAGVNVIAPAAGGFKPYSLPITGVGQ